MKLMWIMPVVFLLVGCAGVDLSPPHKTPLPPSAAEKRLLQEGENEFRQGKFRAALQKAYQALKKNPDNVEALFAVATSYMALGEPEKSLAYSQKAANYQTDHLPDIYLVMGQAYEQLEDPWNALRTYRYAAHQYPGNPLIQFRLGVAYSALNKPEFAAEAFKSSLRANPYNPAAHFELGKLYFIHEYNTPALLSLGMALLLEPREGPAPEIRKNLEELFGRGASKHNKTDEGDFHRIEAALAQAAGKKTGFEFIRKQYRLLFRELAEPSFINQKKTFVLEFYVPFYNQVHRKNLDETFVYYIFQGSENKAMASWLKIHPARVKQLERLIGNYGAVVKPATEKG